MFNVLMDPMPLVSEVPNPIWPNRSYHDVERKIKTYTRTDHPVKYYIIDFGLSIQFAAGEPHIAPITYGGDKTVPEYSNTSGECNPFPLDIYTLGNMIRKHFMQVRFLLSTMSCF